MDYNLNNLLLKVAQVLAGYLDRLLPSLFDSWWEDAVVDKLSFHQQRWVEQKGIVALSSLDLAALLRVLDQNWYQISIEMNLSREARHFVKEMQTVRNRWAHVGTEGFPLEDVYRDLDTLQRFATVIEAEDAFIQEIRVTKISLIERRLTPISKASANEGHLTPGKEAQAAEFEPGQVVLLTSNPEIKGAVVSIMPGKPENRYNVFIGGETRIIVNYRP